MECPECFIGELEELVDCIECPECGAQFEPNADDEDDLVLIEGPDYDEEC